MEPLELLKATELLETPSLEEEASQLETSAPPSVKQASAETEEQALPIWQKTGPSDKLELLKATELLELLGSPELLETPSLEEETSQPETSMPPNVEQASAEMEVQVLSIWQKTEPSDKLELLKATELLETPTLEEEGGKLELEEFSTAGGGGSISTLEQENVTRIPRMNRIGKIFEKRFFMVTSLRFFCLFRFGELCKYRLCLAFYCPAVRL